MKNFCANTLGLLIVSVMCLNPLQGLAQENPIHYQLHSLLYDEGARVAGFGSIASVAGGYYSDAGCYSNPALLSRRKKSLGLNLSYNPRQNQASGSKHINGNLFYSLNKSNALSLHFKSFNNYQKIVTDKTPWDTYYTKNADCKDLIFKLSYAHHFKNGFSAGTSLSYIYYEAKGGMTIMHKTTSLAFGIGLNYDRTLYRSESFQLPLQVGFCSNNLGASYPYYSEDGNEFYPANIVLGAMLSPSLKVNEKAHLIVDLAYEAEKLLVPTPTIPASMEPFYPYWFTETDPDTRLWQYYLRSFSDAPGGGKEELQEIIHSYGVELRWENDEHFSYALRGGLHKEHKNKGRLQYYTLGAGVNYYGITLNISQYFDKRENQDYETWFLQLGYSYNF
ncbi:MAG: PorV/PorQ family protein [Bacteroidales bacterium]|nr:PorV/PorQ family protein [Bacteroidales bacterium]MCF8458133.1 PorV/PorQ family protein [Bacteroidales bacterium]